MSNFVMEVPVISCGFGTFTDDSGKDINWASVTALGETFSNNDSAGRKTQKFPIVDKSGKANHALAQQIVNSLSEKAEKEYPVHVNFILSLKTTGGKASLSIVGIKNG